MRLKQVREDVLFYAITIATFLLLAILSVLFLHREQTRNQQLLEIETLRLAADLLETIRQRPYADPSDLRPDVVGFGIYGADGVSISRFGTAPTDLRAFISDPANIRTRLNRVEFRKNRLIILRSLGIAPMMREQTRGMMRSRMKDQAPPLPLDAMPFPMGRVVYLERDVRDWQTTQQLIQMGFYLVPSLLVLIFLGTTMLYRKNLSYRQNESRNRELVQLGEAARTLAHEIKNPLGAIRIQTATLQKVLPEPYHRNLQVISEEVDRLRVLVDKVGDFLKNPVGEPEPVEVEPMVKDLLTRFPQPIDLSVDRSKGPLIVWIDKNRFRTVLENLVKNAVESLLGVGESSALPSVGMDRSVAEFPPQDGASKNIQILLDRQKDRVEIRVLDRGVGLPKGSEDRIFDPFFTTKPTGSGIGLAISKRFVEAAGGALEVRPRSGGGTEARITLPCYAGENRSG